ncbi:MAG: LytR/AlgR family response regulator transcription factor [Akkermansiaceae bacterium]
MKIRTLIVDDEPLARQGLRLLASEELDLEIIGECENGPDALVVIENNAPALLFLDVQMPEMDGFELLAKLPRDRLPLVIFTTAYNQHAVRAFEAHALDYLLKPIRQDRFRDSVARARMHMKNQEANAAARGLLGLLAAQQSSQPGRMPESFLTRLTIKSHDRVVVVKILDVDSIESAGNYVAVNVGKESHILRETLNVLESQLDPEKFFRISRSAIVNLERVRELQPMSKGEHVIVLQNGRRLAMTRGMRDVERALRFG